MTSDFDNDACRCSVDSDTSVTYQGLDSRRIARCLSCSSQGRLGRRNAGHEWGMSRGIVHWVCITDYAHSILEI
jgi:hypothetical protein